MLKKDFSLVSKETMQLKKKYKGIYAIEPENENDFWNHLAKNLYVMILKILII